MLNLEIPTISKNSPKNDHWSMKILVESEIHGGLFNFGIYQQSPS